MTQPVQITRRGILKLLAALPAIHIVDSLAALPNEVKTVGELHSLELPPPQLYSVFLDFGDIQIPIENFKVPEALQPPPSLLAIPKPFTPSIMQNGVMCATVAGPIDRPLRYMQAWTDRMMEWNQFVPGVVDRVENTYRNVSVYHQSETEAPLLLCILERAVVQSYEMNAHFTTFDLGLRFQHAHLISHPELQGA